MTNIDNPTSSNPGMSSIPPFSGSLLSLIPWVKSRYNKNVKYGPQKNTNTTHGKKTAAARFGVKTCCLQDLHDKWDICTWKQADWFGGISVINRVQYTSCWWKISGVYQLPCKISSYLQGLILVKWLAGFLQNWTIQEDIWEQKHDTKLESRKLQHFKSLFESYLCKQTPYENAPRYCWWFRNPANHLEWMYKTLQINANNGINYQPQLVNAKFLTHQPYVYTHQISCEF